MKAGVEETERVNQLRPAISVVVPVYKSAQTLPDLVHRIEATLSGEWTYEVILVDDGSGPDTWTTVVQLCVTDPSVRGVRLSRNYGQHSALVAGIRAASHSVLVTIDDDLQNPPEEIPRMVDALLNSPLDVVYGVPENTNQSLSRRLAGRVTRLALGHGLGIDSAIDVSSFRCFHTVSRDAFNGELGTNVSLDALLTWGNSRFGNIRVRHDPRLVGKSNYSFRKLLSFAIDTATGYSTVPLQAASLLGIATATLGFLLLVWVVGRPLLTGETVPGFPFLASAIAFFSGVQLLTLGIIGEYLSRVHFRIMRKPTYVVRETEGNSFPFGTTKTSP